MARSKENLLRAILWGVAGSVLTRVWKGDCQIQVLVFMLVVTHWVLDFVSHRPDMPLWPGDSPLFGLALWNSVAATLALEGILLSASLWLYLRSTSAIDWIGSAGFWLLILFSTLMWASQPWSPPPPSPQVLAWFGLGSWLFPIWAGWVDRHRRAQPMS
jgi:hypothetical protein